MVQRRRLLGLGLGLGDVDVDGASGCVVATVVAAAAAAAFTSRLGSVAQSVRLPPLLASLLERLTAC